ncbi:MAG: hypothetical protein ACRENI_10195 [Gemmatimonadaceae bacterium]
MAQRSPRSLRHEYELFVEREIESYKESVPRNALLSIGDEAVAALADQQQLALTEVVLCEEVDRIIRGRLRVPTYQTWRRRRLRELEELRRPEHWGLCADDPLVRSLRAGADARVLIAGRGGSKVESSALYLAAHGCDITAIGDAPEGLERVIEAAEAAGLSERIHASVSGIDALAGNWNGSGRLAAVICSPDAFAGLSPQERARVIKSLQQATNGGGIHLMVVVSGAEAADTGAAPVTVEELRRRYRGWEVTVGPALGSERTFFARKAVA